MDTLLSKLTDLAYEFFGVVLPGFFCLLFLTLLWISVGPMLEDLTAGNIPDLTVATLVTLEGGLSSTLRAEIGVLLLVLCYFLGQLVNWLSRRIPLKLTRPKETFADELIPLFEETSKRLSPNGQVMPWAQFYPVAKALIAEDLSYSLVQTYQHKYTLHRCVAALGAGAFWVSLGTLVLALLPIGDVAPRWYLLIALAVSSLCLALQFWRSYTYFWRMWGNTIVTEAYALVCVSKAKETSEPED